MSEPVWREKMIAFILRAKEIGYKEGCKDSEGTKNGERISRVRYKREV